MLPIQVVAQLRQTSLMGLFAVPAFQFDEVLVLKIGDHHIQAFFFRDLGFFERMAFPVQDGIEERQKHQATVALQKILVFLVVLRLHELLKLEQHRFDVQAIVGGFEVFAKIVVPAVVDFSFYGHVVVQALLVDAVVDGQTAIFLKNTVHAPKIGERFIGVKRDHIAIDDYPVYQIVEGWVVLQVFDQTVKVGVVFF